MNAFEGLPIQFAVRVLKVSKSGRYDWHSYGASDRDVRHAWLFEQIQAVRHISKGVYGASCVPAEPTRGLGIQVGHTVGELTPYATPRSAGTAR